MEGIRASRLLDFREERMKKRKSKQTEMGLYGRGKALDFNAITKFVDKQRWGPLLT